MADAVNSAGNGFRSKDMVKRKWFQLKENAIEFGTVRKPTRWGVGEGGGVSKE